jgi:hypothetical protein
MKNAPVISGPIDVPNRLKQLGLKEFILRLGAEQGQAEWANCTLNDPPMFRGLVPWARTLRSLRESMIPEGWERLEDGGQSFVVNKSGTLAITAATGDRHTGVKGETPSTKSSKDPKTQLAIAQNALAWTLYGDIRTAEKQKADSRITWILLFYRDTETSEIRCELSLPASMNDEGQVDEWKERIILTAIPFGDGGARIKVDSPTPDINIDVQRRRA